VELLPELLPLAPPEDGDDGDLLDELPMEPLPLALPELLPGLLGEVEDELPPVAALPLFLVVSELEPAPALSRLQAAMPTASTKAVTAAVNAFILHLLWKGNGNYPL
jgi:hypothetical protein